MKRYVCFLCGLMMLALACGPALAQDDPAEAPRKKKAAKARKKAPRKRGGKQLRGYYAILSSVCKLTDEQKAKMADAAKAHKDALVAWNQANKAKLDELRKAMAEARKAKDKDKMKDLARQRKELEASRKEIDAQKDKILEVLTPEQKITWEGHLLYQSAMRRFKKVGLTDEQTDKIRALCADKGKDAAEADEKAKKRLRGDLAKTIQADVLTEDQKAKLKGGGKKERPAKPKKERTKKAKSKKAEQ